MKHFSEPKKLSKLVLGVKFVRTEFHFFALRHGDYML